jgi:LPS export ABC transporter protein LptC
LKIWIFCFALLAISLTLGFVLSPAGRSGAQEETLPEVELDDYKIYDVDIEGVKQTLFAKEGRHYADREEFTYPAAIVVQDGVWSKMSANEGVYMEDTLSLSGDVLFDDMLGRRLKTESAEYNKKSGIFKGAEGFQAAVAEGRINGRGFTADMQNRTIEAWSVRLVIDVKNL